LRLAIYGGTFDPVHDAHLAVAREAARECELDRVLFIPASHPPHKAGATRASYEDRYRMVELACAGEPRFEPSRLEEGEERSYSIRTIEKVLASIAPESELYFLIGADAFAEIGTWCRWRDVVRLVRFVVVSRPGHLYDVPDGARVHRLESLDMPVSSSEIRQRLAAGDYSVPVPPAVLAYIRERGLYRAG
jgi:nicotinate-nucleotide adenylyltransferase